MAKKAMAYSSDIVLGRTGEVVGRREQKELIRQYAEENDIEIVAWFEDEIYEEDVLARPGIQGLLASDTGCDCVLVERVWSLSRSPKEVRRFLKELDRQGARLESATVLWDCTSQMARWYYRGDPMSRRSRRPQVEEKPRRNRTSRPDTLRFTGLKPDPEEV